jgi:hypothetical protein
LQGENSSGGIWSLKYRLVYTHRAARDISGLEANVQKRIGKALKRYLEEPLQLKIVE